MHTTLSLFSSSSARLMDGTSSFDDTPLIASSESGTSGVFAVFGSRSFQGLLTFLNVACRSSRSSIAVRSSCCCCDCLLLDDLLSLLLEMPLDILHVSGTGGATTGASDGGAEGGADVARIDPATDEWPYSSW